MRGTRGPENLAGETILKFHSLSIDDDFFGSGRRAVPPWTGAVCDIYLSLQVSGFIGRGSRKDSWVTEAGAKQGPHHKEEEDATNHGDGGGDFHC